MGGVRLMHTPSPVMHLDPVLVLVIQSFALNAIELEEHVGLSHFNTLLKWSRSTQTCPSRYDRVQGVIRLFVARNQAAVQFASFSSGQPRHQAKPDVHPFELEVRPQFES